jgi:hypothetical protein
MDRRRFLLTSLAGAVAARLPAEAQPVGRVYRIGILGDKASDANETVRWQTLGLIAVGLHRQGWDLQLTQYGDGHWRATFYVTGAAHSIVGRSAWEPTPWRAVQRAVWEASLKTKVDDDFSVVLAAASLLTLSFLV